MAERAQIISTSVPGHKLSREEHRRQKDLEAARKAGTAPAALDESGKEINPHIPEYISRAPWYASADASQPSLSHQRKEAESGTKLDQWYERGARVGPAAKKYRKGACENCGAMTHKRQDCVERPRKRGAKFTNKDIMADEKLEHFDGDYDAKRDRWNGYDNSTYKSIVDDYEAMDAQRRKIKEAEIDAQDSADVTVAKEKKERGEDDFGSSDEENEDEDKYAEAAEQVGQRLDHKDRITVRNLRIREDTAKYLINLNPESAYYDPKTRAMRDAPEEGKNPEDMKFAGDNFTRFSGDVTNMQKLQMFAWQSSQRGHDLHAQANPTAGEMLMKEFHKKKEVMKDTTKTSILAKYGGEEHLERLPQELLSGQTENYVEYSRTGQVIKGKERAKARSKYEEDVYTNNHKSVWGSFFDRENSSWGYACCHSIISGSYCTGEAGKAANTASGVNALLESAEERRRIEREAEADRKRQAAAPVGGAGATGDEVDDDEDGRKDVPTYGKTRVGEGDEIELDKRRLRRAVEEEKKRKAMGEDEAWQHAKKSKTDVTQEEMEAYRLSKQAFDDPMANYKDDES